ncbi:Asp-tRNA(Asn)/Glu-tRNA(Gln) amidotransferase subunit GatA [Lacibacterium aquatile]|uniref:Glutamyl-tRNA(Gln) amidotransferase subunit A n=1 Tax=Lacibacterium aquatile TaxID=1168082 RepID=A0ABW5DXU9_9PROT
MTGLLDKSVAGALKGLASKEFTAVELTDAYIAQAEKTRSLNAFITETFDKARDEAKASDARRAAGNAGAMDGIPVGIKDLFCTEGTLTTAASHILDGFVPQYESTVSGKLKAAGVVSLGKLNLDEFAMGGANLHSYYGPARNPWDPTLVPGGSSGGSAAAVSARAVMAATGTDTGGSIRQPGAYCGIVGLKPTYGRCSRWGIVAFASSLDQAGPMARTVEDAAIMLGSMAGFDPKDSTSANVAVPDFAKALTGDIRGLKVGVPKEYRVDGMNPEIVALWDKGVEWLKAAGAEVVEISLPHTKHALATYYVIAPAEASSNLARYDGVRYGLRVPGETLDDMYELTRAAGFGREVKRRILIGTYVLSAGYYDAYYLKAQRVRALVAQDFTEAFKKVDVILTPTAPTPAFSIEGAPEDPVAMYLNDVFTVPASLAGIPGINVPAGLSSGGLPLGLQILGRPFDEETVIRAAGVMEASAAFSAKPSIVA